MNHVRTVLDDAGALLRRRAAISGAARGIAWALVLVLAVLLIDAAAGGGTALRVLLLLLAVLGVIVLPLWFCWRQLRAVSEESVLRACETALGDRNRCLTSAAQLADMPGELAQLGAARMHQQIDLSLLTKNLPPMRLRAALLLSGSVVATAVLIVVVAPDLIGRSVQRLTNATADVPAWSPTRLSWALCPERARVGHRVRVHIQSEGRDAAQVELTVDDGIRPDRIAMFPLGGGLWAADVTAGRTPLTVRGEGGGTSTVQRAIAIDPIPELSAVTIQADAPAYADLPREIATVSGGRPWRADLLDGTAIRISASASLPIDRLWLSCDGQTWTALDVTTATAAWMPESAQLEGAWRLAAESAGVRGPDITIAEVRYRRDQAPRVSISKPARDSLATPGMSVPLAWNAEDDLGLAFSRRGRELDGLGAPVLTAAINGRTWTLDQTLDLPTLGVKAGDVITLTLMARDRKPGGGQPSPLAQRVIHIIDERSYNDMLRDRMGADALRNKYRAVLAKLGELERASASAAAHAADRSELAHLAAAMRELQNKVDAMRRENRLFESEETLQDDLHQRLEALAQAAEEGNLDELRALTEEQQAAPLEEDLQAQLDLAKSLGLLGMLRRIADAQQNVVSAIAPLAEPRRLDEQEQLDLRSRGDDEHQLADGLAAWLLQADLVATDLGLSAPDLQQQVVALLQRVRSEGAENLLREAATALRKADAVEGHRLAQEARDLLLALFPDAAQAEAGMREAAAQLGFGLGRLGGKGKNGKGNNGQPGQGNGGAGAQRDLMALARAFMNGAGGMGGAGRSGMGLFLGYGGDNSGHSDAGTSMDLIGPEQLAQSAGDARAQNLDAVARLANRGGTATRQTAEAQRQRRDATAAGHGALGQSEREQVGDYFKKLEDTGSTP